MVKLIFSWNKQSGLNPLNIERAKGIYLQTRDGRKIIDFSSQLMNVNIGHGHPKVAEAVAILIVACRVMVNTAQSLIAIPSIMIRS